MAFIVIVALCVCVTVCLVSCADVLQLSRTLACSQASTRYDIVYEGPRDLLLSMKIYFWGPITASPSAKTGYLEVGLHPPATAEGDKKDEEAEAEAARDTDKLALFVVPHPNCTNLLAADVPCLGWSIPTPANDEEATLQLKDEAVDSSDVKAKDCGYSFNKWFLELTPKARVVLASSGTVKLTLTRRGVPGPHL